MSLDPLLAAQRHLSHLTTALSSAPRRRLSDPSTTAQASTTSHPLAVRSRDGSRWLPTPDELVHREGRSSQHTEVRDETSEAPSLPQHGCSAAVCAVAKVFETTELLESILCCLNTRDVLSLRRTNKHWNSTVHSSPYLRLHFFAYPQWERPSQQYQLLPLNLQGVAVEEDEPIHLGRWIKVSLTSEAAKRICPEPRQRVRSRSIFEGLRGGLGRSSNEAWPANRATPAKGAGFDFEDLHVTQPPLLGMQAYLVGETAATDPAGPLDHRMQALSLLGGERSARREPHAVAKLSCDSGITLGFLAQTAQELLDSRASGPSSITETKVVFKAIVSFGPADASPRKLRRNWRTVTRIG